MSRLGFHRAVAFSALKRACSKRRGSLLVAMLAMLCLSESLNAESKDEIVQSIREGHARLQEQLAAFEIHGEVRYGDEKQPVAFEMTCYALGEHMRSDLKSTRQWRATHSNEVETKAIVASPARCFQVLRMSESSPFVLVEAEDDVNGYQKRATQLGVIGWAPFALFGLNSAEFLESKGVTITSDSRPDAANPTWRRIEFRGNPEPQYRDANGAFTFDIARDWRLIEYEIKNQGAHTVFKVLYGDDVDGRPNVARVQVRRGTASSPFQLAHDYRITSISFEPPDESLFTLEHFGIYLDDGSYVPWYVWPLGGGVFLIALGYVGRRLYRRYEERDGK